jgi:hypothetical protein
LRSGVINQEFYCARPFTSGFDGCARQPEIAFEADVARRTADRDFEVALLRDARPVLLKRGAIDDNGAKLF